MAVQPVSDLPSHDPLPDCPKWCAHHDTIGYPEGQGQYLDLGYGNRRMWAVDYFGDHAPFSIGVELERRGDEGHAVYVVLYLGDNPDGPDRKGGRDGETVRLTPPQAAQLGGWLTATAEAGRTGDAVREPAKR